MFSTASRSGFVLPPLGAFAFACGITLAACESGPKPGEEALYYAAQLASDDARARDVAMKELLKLKDKRSLPALHQAMKGDDADLRSEAAQLLGVIGEASSAAALIEGIDWRAGAGSDKKGRAAATANERIAKALGAVADRSDDKAIDALRRLAGSAHLNTQLGAVWALGELRAQAAVKDLTDIAEGHENNFMVKNAIIALGEIGDAQAVPALVRLLFFERGVSFYREASYALFQIGKPAVAPLLEVYQGKYAPITDLHVDVGVQKAKAIEVLGDIGDERALPMALESAAQRVDDTASALTRAKADFMLGRLGVKQAVPVLVKHWDDVDVSKSEFAVEAVAQIGARDQVPALLAMTTHEGYVRQCVKEQKNQEGQCRFSEAQVRRPRLLALSRLSTGAELSVWQSMIAESTKLAAEEGAKASSSDAVEKQIAEAAKKGHEKTQKLLEERLPMLEAAKACGDAVECWAQKLGDANPRVRERAGYALMSIGGDAALRALGKALGDPDNEARYAAILAVWRSLPQGALSAELGARVDEILESEKGKTQYVRINEDLKRLKVKLARGY